MKIKAISRINSLGVFKNFIWDENVLMKGGKVGRFEEINILYGRNYSGKTTLSRIFRRIENKERNPAYAGASYEIQWYDDTESNQDNCVEQDVNIRVYNEDFRRENLHFPNCIDDDRRIVPFAILGENNVSINHRINEILDQLGSDDDENGKGKYHDLKLAKKSQSDTEKELNKLVSSFEDSRHNFCTKDKKSIKKQHDLYGDINYDVRKLDNDISTIERESIVVMDDDSRKNYLLIAQSNSMVPLEIKTGVDKIFHEICEETAELLQHRLCDDQKIEELVNNAVLEDWVYRGKQLHSNTKKICKFCGNKISDERWEMIVNHFDVESEKELQKIDILINRLSDLKAKLNNMFDGVTEGFFNNLKSDVKQLLIEYMGSKHIYNEKIDYVISKLEEKKHMLSTSVDFQSTNFNFDATFISQYNILVNEHNIMANNLTDRKKDAKLKLRLDAVARYLDSSKYYAVKSQISFLKGICLAHSRNINSINQEIETLRQELLDCENSLSDERAGANAVNDYLNKLKDCNLSLRVVDDGQHGGKYFMVCRGENAAHNLSEGEKSLIAFCYFVARLRDVNSDSISKIIWIDDPISSLDSNHVFFIYSMIQSEIVEDEKVEQLFVSTHNLLFLKYLKRLQRVVDRKAAQKGWFIIERNSEKSRICAMPEFMKEYVSEFVFLFKQVHECASASAINDENYDYYYNFGNCARKFLELYISFIRPYAIIDGKFKESSLRLLFDDDMEAISLHRSINELSHLIGGIERSQLISEYPEFHNLARSIVKFVYTYDSEQYQSLCDSAKVTPIFS